MFDLTGFLTPLAPLVIIAFLFLYVKKNVIGEQKPLKHEGVIMVIESDGRFMSGLTSRRVWTYALSRVGAPTLSANVYIGNVLSQQGRQAKIALNGEWKRLDENTITGELFVSTHGAGARKEWVLKVGEELPLSQVHRAVMNSGTRYIKIVHLYIPEDAETSNDI
ncbi:MAG: hypothetical protein FWE24_06835 [Defluviitaleaceae bacterium]|nr:hypothetical protein [Defluviitaleaceae bacterium]